MSSATQVAGMFKSEVIGLPSKWLGIHRSVQILVELPSPILLTSPFCKTSLPAKIARHVWLACFFLVADRNVGAGSRSGMPDGDLRWLAITHLA